MLHATITDAINNRRIASTEILIQKDDMFILNNSSGQLNSLHNKNSLFKASIDEQADMTYTVTPIKFAGDKVVIKLAANVGREKRRFVRVKCNDSTIVTFGTEIFEGTITELAYGSLIVITKVDLVEHDKIAVRLTEMDDETVLICSVFAKNDGHSNPNDIWFTGYPYIALIDAEKSGVRAMDMLYAKIYKLIKSQGEQHG